MVSGVSSYAWFGAKKKTETVEQPTVEQKAGEQKAAVQAPAVAVAPTAPKADKAIEKELKDKRDAVAKKMNMLNNTEWQIEMAPMAAAAAKAKKEIEIVTFKNSQVTFTGFGKKGFPTTNLTLTIQDDGSVIWETMQTSEKNGVCFWRGELDKTMMNMRGVLSHKVDAKTKLDYSFASTARKAIPADK